MKICGIICEYNPLHFGHKYQIDKTREKLGDDTIIIAIMSGNFVQRGEIAVLHKTSRAKMAVLSGVDLVIELPLNYVLSSAENFAFGAIDILGQMGITHLSFGSECGDISKLYKIVDIITDKTFKEDIYTHMKTGKSFATSREENLRKISDEYADIIKSPNNILAIEYLKMLQNTEIMPLTITRKDTPHDSDIILNNFSSASNIRNLIKNNIDVRHLLPDFEILEQSIKDGRAAIFMQELELAIFTYLRRITIDELLHIRDCDSSLANRIYNLSKTHSVLDELIDDVSTKRYTKARVRRIILSVFLGLKKDIKPEYIRVLAFNNKGRTILRQKKSVLPIVTRYMDYKHLENTDYFRLDNFAEDIYSLLYKEKEAKISGNLYRISGLYLDNSKI